MKYFRITAVRSLYMCQWYRSDRTVLREILNAVNDMSTNRYYQVNSSNQKLWLKVNVVPLATHFIIFKSPTSPEWVARDLWKRPERSTHAQYENSFPVPFSLICPYGVLASYDRFGLKISINATRSSTLAKHNNRIDPAIGPLEIYKKYQS